MRDEDWKIIQILYQNLNLTKAADIVCLSQPALTKRLQQIEEELGVKVVNRSTKGLTFTPQGAYLVQQAEKILALVQETKHNVVEMWDGQSGTIRIGSAASFAREQLPSLLKEYKEHYADVEFDINVSLSGNVVKMVQNSEVHVGFMKGDYPFTEGMVKVSSEQGYLFFDRPIEIEELPNMGRVDHNRDKFTVQVIDSWWYDLFDHPPVICMNVNNKETSLEMIKNGLGYGIFFETDQTPIYPQLFVKKMEYRNGTPLTRNTWMMYRSASGEVPLVANFISFIREKMER